MQEYTDGLLRPHNLDDIPVVPPRGVFMPVVRYEDSEGNEGFYFLFFIYFILFFFSKE